MQLFNERILEFEDEPDRATLEDLHTFYPSCIPHGRNVVVAGCSASKTLSYGNYFGAVYTPDGHFSDGTRLYQLIAVSPSRFQDEGSAIAWALAWQPIRRKEAERLARIIIRAFLDIKADSVAKYATVYSARLANTYAEHVTGDVLEVIDDAGFRGILVGNPFDGSYAYLYADNHRDDGKWESGGNGFLSIRELTNRILAVCAAQQTKGVRYCPTDGESENALIAKLAILVQKIAKLA